MFKSCYVPGSSAENNKPPHFISPTLKEIFKTKITEAEIFPTRNCSENCVGCSVPTTIRWGKEKRKPVAWWQNLILKMVKNKVDYIMIMGGEPTTYPSIEKLISLLAKLKKQGKINGGIFTDGIPLRRTPERLELLITNGLLDLTTHSSVDYLVENEPPMNAGRQLGTSRKHKAFYGLELLKALKKRGAKSVVANTVVMPDNLNQIIPLYKKFEDEEINMTIVPIQWQCHLYQGRKAEDFLNRLTIKDTTEITKIINFVLDKERKKVSHGKKRTVLNSSRYLRALPFLGVAQPLGCNNFSGPPGVIAVLPDGSLRHCPIVTRLSDVSGCPGCHYGFRDRDQKFDSYLKAMGIFEDQNEKDFPNIVHQK